MSSSYTRGPSTLVSATALAAVAGSVVVGANHSARWRQPRLNRLVAGKAVDLDDGTDTRQASAARPWEARSAFP